MKLQKIIRRLALLTALCLLLGCAAFAADVTVSPNRPYALSEKMLTREKADGIYISSVPSEAVCRIEYGTRSLRAGDVLPAQALDSLNIRAVGELQTECSLVYCPIESGCVGCAKTLCFRLTGSKNTPPSAEDSEFETYKNIANTGKLTVSDPDGDSLHFTVTKEPKRGTVQIREDGSFTYTPEKNKVGKDYFRYTAADDNGGVSEEATVKINIVKPIDEAAFADVSAGDAYAAAWCREQRAYSGKRIGDMLCFCPDEPVSRGEFLVMAMQVFGMKPETARLSSGFADEKDAPAWMRPYIVSAMRNGVVAGTPGEEGLRFRPNDSVSYAEAAVMVQNLLRLPQTQRVFADDAPSVLPAWAHGAVGALREAKIDFDFDREGGLTRLDAAKLLCTASNI